MIVYCEKCNSKFQVDDAKIPDAGIKARCSVCSHAFILKKEPVMTSSASAPQPKPQTPPAQAQEKAEGPADFDTSVFNDAARDNFEKPRPLMGSGGPFFSRSAAESAVESSEKTAGQGDVIVEVTETDSFDDAEDINEAGTEAGDLAGIFSEEPAAADKSVSGYDALASFVERHKHDNGSAYATPQKGSAQFPAASGMEQATTPLTAGSDAAARGESPAKSPTMSAIRIPEVVTSAEGQLPAHQAASRGGKGIITMLDDHGMTDDYVVQMVQEICHAVKYVEGVEKPDWTTRMMGLDMLCKIRGLYAGEKKEDMANRQLQIVTGINM